MEAGNYNIVPCLFDANMEGTFSLVVYASSDFELVRATPPPRPPPSNSLNSSFALSPPPTTSHRSTRAARSRCRPHWSTPLW
jgi:hypothetical protein